MLFAKVAIPVSVFNTFTYIVDDVLEQKIKLGHQVLVPFKNDVLLGFVVAISKNKDINLSLNQIKKIIDIYNPDYPLKSHLLKLGNWIADYYISPLGMVYPQMTPNFLSQKIEPYITLTEEICVFLKNKFKNDTDFISFIEANKEKTIKVKNLADTVSLLMPNKANQLIKKELNNFIIYKTNITEEKIKYQTILQLNNEYKKLLNTQKNIGVTMKKIINILEKEGKISTKELKKKINFSNSSIKRLIEKKIILTEKREIRRIPAIMNQEFDIVEHHKLNPHQADIVEQIAKQINKHSFQTNLIYGVTGSGKTLIYINAAQIAMNEGYTVIILVPEISLTPQAINIFNSYFPNKVAVLHSNLSKGERYDVWRGIYNGKYKLVIGPRSAIFAPLENIGLIIVDEEHDDAYKQNRMPFYNGRDIAVVMGKYLNCPVILGSATPTIESMNNAEIGKYNLFILNKRIHDRQLPEIELIDMKKEKRIGIYSKKLLVEMEKIFKKGLQVIILQNKRGYYNIVQCNTCGYIFECPNCSVSMKYHHDDFTLQCHYCEYKMPAPVQCPQCHSIDLNYSGFGTQRIKDDLETYFPDKKIMRVDRDISSKKNKLELILAKFRNHEIDVLVGTQIISKGLDFPNVALVGVIDADIILNFPDFRSQEKTFQLLSQVAGRSGRHQHKGKVIIQTMFPDNYTLNLASQHNYMEFYRREISKRKMLIYPPFVKLIRFIIKHKNEKVAENLIKEIEVTLKKYIAQFETQISYWQILGPAPCPITKIQSNYRFHILLKYKEIKLFRKIIRNSIEELSYKCIQNLSIDVDPTDML